MANSRALKAAKKAADAVVGRKPVVATPPNAKFVKTLQDALVDGLELKPRKAFGPIRVAVVSGADNTTVLVQPFDPFGGDFTGGGFVAAADIDPTPDSDPTVNGAGPGGPVTSVADASALTDAASQLFSEAYFVVALQSRLAAARRHLRRPAGV